VWGRAEPIPHGYSTAPLKLTHYPPGANLEANGQATRGAPRSRVSAITPAAAAPTWSTAISAARAARPPRLSPT